MPKCLSGKSLVKLTGCQTAGGTDVDTYLPELFESIEQFGKPKPGPVAN